MIRLIPILLDIDYEVYGILHGKLVHYEVIVRTCSPLRKRNHYSPFLRRTEAPFPIIKHGAVFCFDRLVKES